MKERILKSVVLSSLISVASSSLAEVVDLRELQKGCAAKSDGALVTCLQEALNKANTSWVFSESVNPMNDEVTRVLAKKEEPPERPQGYSLMLGIRCGSEVYASIDAGRYIGSKNTIQYRFDKDQARTEEWHSTDSKTAFIAPGGKEFVNKLIQSKRLVFQFDVVGKGTRVAVFNLDGIDKAVKRIVSTCPVS